MSEEKEPIFADSVNITTGKVVILDLRTYEALNQKIVDLQWELDLCRKVKLKNKGNVELTKFNKGE